MCKEVNLAVNNEETRLMFIDHKHGEMSVESQLVTYNPDAVIVVMAVDDTDSMLSAELLLSYLTRLGIMETKPVILVANKSDLVRNRTIKHSGKC